MLAPSKMNLVLYTYWRSSSSWRVRFALDYKQISYEARYVNLRESEQLAAEHKRLSPMGVVPCLVVDGRALVESVAILEFLEEVAPERPLMPTDPWRRARVRQLVQIVNSGIQPLQNLTVLARVSTDENARMAWARYYIERGLAALDASLGTVEEELGSARYSVGDELSLADIYLFSQASSAARFGVGLDGFPRVKRLHAEIGKLEAAVSSAPENQPDAPPRT
jgi:maleylacetoacetate isomerase